jgi:uncharacterized protein
LLYPLRELGVRWLLLLALALFALQAGLRMNDARNAVELGAWYQSQVEAGTLPTGPDDEGAARLAEWEQLEKRARPSIEIEEAQLGIAAIGSGSFGEFYRAGDHQRGAAADRRAARVLAGCVATMLLGMALLRAGVLTLKALPATYRWLMIAGYGIGLPLAAWELRRCSAVVSTRCARLNSWSITTCAGSPSRWDTWA